MLIPTQHKRQAAGAARRQVKPSCWAWVNLEVWLVRIDEGPFQSESGEKPCLARDAHTQHGLHNRGARVKLKCGPLFKKSLRISRW